MKILYNFFSLRRINISVPFILVLVTFSELYSQNSSVEIKPFQNTLIFGLDAGINLPQTDYEKSKIGYAFKGTFEYFFKTKSIHYFGGKLTGGYDQVTGEDSRGTISTQNGTTNIPPKFSTGNFTLGLALTYGISINNIIIPYVSGGISEIWFDPTNGEGQTLPGSSTGLYEKNTIAYNVEGGVKFLASDKLSVNLSVNQYLPQSDYIEDVAAAYSDDAYTTILVGVSFAPFYKSDPDNDGISGSKDICPTEAEDFDGFEDEDGCPELDNDGDGILDINDKCPNDPEDFDGFEDDDGCPELDNDGDGILDINDKCPNEAEDFDGTLDDDGCPEITDIAEIGTLVLESDQIFTPNSAMIMVEGKQHLDEIVAQLKKFPDAKWRTEGHTDSNGSKKFLRNLSLDRAKAVLEYFVNFGGLNRENFQVFGMGDNSPIADNNTEEGRKLNNRIKIIPLDVENSQNNIEAPVEEFNQFILRGDDTFEPNSANIMELANVLLDEIKNYIKNHPGGKWSIIGYMDNQGSTSFLKKLSYNRAEAVYNYFISAGLSTDQFTISGMGNADPIGSNNTEAGRSMNRRVMIIREK